MVDIKNMCNPMKERQENVDTLKPLREELCQNLRFYAQSDSDFNALEGFKNGSFLLPDSTTKTIKRLPDEIEGSGDADPMELRRLRGLYEKIIHGGS